MQARFFVSLFAFALVFLPVPVARVAHAATDMPAEIEKTFDFGTPIEHTVSTQKGILAFNDYNRWEQYLNNPSAFNQLQIYTIARDRWKATGAFSSIIDVFAPLGYDATFSGFEKLFVFPAEKCSFYPELEDLGIRKTDRFPYPGTISFTLTPKL